MAEPPLVVALIGHVDSGKTDLFRALCGAAPAADEVPAALGKYAWVLERLAGHRERDVTVDNRTAPVRSGPRELVLVDTPGHRDFFRNLARGLSIADAAVVTVSAVPGEFEASYARDGGTRQQLLAAFTLGVKQLVVAITKMDHVAYAEPRFSEITTELASCLRRVGYRPEKVQFIPVSARERANLDAAADALRWHAGPTLCDALAALPAPVRKPDGPLRVPVFKTLHVPGAGTVVTARVASGTLRVGDRLTVSPDGDPGAIPVEVASIEHFGESLRSAAAGDYVGLNLPRNARRRFPTGAVLSPAVDPAPLVAEFTAQLIVLDHPNELRPGYTPLFCCHTAAVPCRLVRLIDKLDRATGKIVENEIRNSPSVPRSAASCSATCAPRLPSGSSRRPRQSPPPAPAS